ncbi:hypothetical protein BDF14DRAFT_1716972, partial [Spinellus fusiger]
KASEKDLRHLEKIIRKGPFAPYNQLKLEMLKIQVDVCRNTLINYCNQLVFGSFYVKHALALTLE